MVPDLSTLGTVKESCTGSHARERLGIGTRYKREASK